MRLSLIQMVPTSDVDRNIEQASSLLARAVESDRPDAIMLPEMWSCLGGTRETKFGSAESLPNAGDHPSAEGKLYRFLSGIARQYGIWVHGGSIAELAGDRLKNTSLLFDPSGREVARYSKLHLFDITTPSGEGYRESATFAPGDAVVTAEFGDLKAGLAICYDIRFGELFASLRNQGVSLIMLPAAFTAETGAAHWETLLRARAIETQCWVAACGTAGTHIDADCHSRQTYGHSMIVDPWGTIVAQASNGEGWTTAAIDQSLVQRTRDRMPVQSHRRLAVS